MAGKFFLKLFLIGLVLSACTPRVQQIPETGFPEGELGSILRAGILVISTDPDYPPQSKLIEGEKRAPGTLCEANQYTANQFEGFDIDVAIEIAARLDVEPCFVTPTWGQIVGGGWADHWNVNVGSMAITMNRMDKLYFTQPYTTGEAVLFVHEDNTTINGPEDLSGKRVGVCAGCAYEEYIMGTLKIPGFDVEYRLNDAIPVGYDTDTSALLDLSLGDGDRLDAVMTDPDTGFAAIQTGLELKQLDEIIYRDFVAVSVDKRSSSDPVPLVVKLTEIIQAMHADGTLSRLSEKYYNFDHTQAAADYDIYELGQLSEP